MQWRDKVSLPPSLSHTGAGKQGDVNQLSLLQQRLEGNTLDWSKRDHFFPSPGVR